MVWICHLELYFRYYRSKLKTDTCGVCVWGGADVNNGDCMLKLDWTSRVCVDTLTARSKTVGYTNVCCKEIKVYQSGLAY